MTEACMVCGQKETCAECLELDRAAEAKRKQYDREAIAKHGARQNLEAHNGDKANNQGQGSAQAQNALQRLQNRFNEKVKNG